MRILFSIFLVICFFSASAQIPGWESFSPKLPKGVDKLVDFDTDKYGKIWLISSIGEGGLMMYDGKQITQYPISDPELKKLKLVGIAVDDKGNKWIITYERLLQFDANNALFVHPIKISNLYRSEGLTSITSRNGITWFYEEGGTVFYRIANGVITAHSRNILDAIARKAGIGISSLTIKQDRPPRLVLDQQGRLFLHYQHYVLGENHFGFCAYDGTDVSILHQTSEPKLRASYDTAFSEARVQGKADTVVLFTEKPVEFFYYQLTNRSAVDDNGCVWTFPTGTRPLFFKLCPDGLATPYSPQLSNLPSGHLIDEGADFLETGFFFDKKDQPLVSYGNKLLHKVGDKWHVFDSSNSLLPIYLTGGVFKMDTEGNFWALFENTFIKYTTTRQPNYQLSVAPALVNPIPKIGGTYTLDVTSNVSWRVKLLGNLIWESSQYEGKGNATLTITVYEREPRIAQQFPVHFGVVSIKGQGQIAESAFRMTTQDPKIFVTSSLPIPVPDEGGTYNVTVSSKVAWESKSSDNWLTLDTKNGNGNKAIEVKVAANPSAAERRARITISASGETKEISVTQETRLPKVILTSNIPNPVSGDGGKYELTVDATGEWKLTDASDWIKILPQNGPSGKTKVAVEVKMNPSTSQSRLGGFGITPTGGKLAFIDFEQSQLIITALEPETENETFIVYPNPVGDVVTVETSLPFGNARWELYDLSGRALKEGMMHGNKRTIALGVLREGAYILTMTNEGKLLGSCKLIKK